MWALWILPCLLAIGLVEYAGHRWFLHHKDFGFGKDHLQHHKVFSKQFTWVEEPVAWYDHVWIRMLLGLAWSGLLMTPVCIWLSLEAGLTFVAVTVLHAGAWQWIHNLMHRPDPKYWWFIETRYFKYISAFHAVHHHYPRSNYSFLFSPVFDWLFRTRRSL